MADYLQQAEENQKRAQAVIEAGEFVKAWESIGAKVNLIGSLAIGVLCKHRDIDFHIYTDELCIEKSFAAVAEISKNPRIKRVEFINASQTDERCFEWHAWFEDNFGSLWQVDMIQIKRGSFYDGYFEKVAHDIKEAMTKEMRSAILKLKFETPDELKISGIEYYKAVIQDGIRDFGSFLKWRTQHKFEGIIEW